MKIFATMCLLSVNPASAFMAPAVERGCSSLRMSDPRRDDRWGGVGLDEKNKAPPENFSSYLSDTPATSAPKMSKAIPFMERPKHLDGTVAGDVGFDPLNFCKSKLDVTYYREAEVKHARLAMLAAAGWPISELFDRKIANILGMEPIVDATNRAPSVLNGGLGKVSIVYWIVVALAASALDVYGITRAGKDGYVPGDLGFDPLGLYPKTEAGKLTMQTKEIKNGRLAMVAITIFAGMEFFSQTAIVDQFPIFFKPFWEVMFSDNAATTLDSVSSVVDTPAPSIFEPVPFEAAVTDSVEAASSAIPSMDAVQAVPAIPPAESISATSVEATAVTPPVDIVSTNSVEAASSTVTPTTDDAELAAAKKRIVELEAKIAAISDLTR